MERVGDVEKGGAKVFPMSSCHRTRYAHLLPPDECFHFRIPMFDGQRRSTINFEEPGVQFGVHEIIQPQQLRGNKREGAVRMWNGEY